MNDKRWYETIKTEWLNMISDKIRQVEDEIEQGKRRLEKLYQHDTLVLSVLDELEPSDAMWVLAPIL